MGLTPYQEQQKARGSGNQRFREEGEPRGWTEGKLLTPCTPDDSTRTAFRLEMERVQETFNDQFVKCPERLADELHERVAPSDIRVDTLRIRRSLLNKRIPRALESYTRIFLNPNESERRKAVKSGFLYDNAIASLVETFYRLTINGKSIVVKGAQQSGKTSFISGLLFMGPFMFMHTLSAGFSDPTIYAPLLFCPNMNDLETEMIASLKNFFAIFGQVDIFGKNIHERPARAAQYFDPSHLREELFNETKGRVISESIFESQILDRSCDTGLDDFFLTPKSKAPFHITKRELGSMDASRSYLQKCIERGFHPLITPDEPQWGAREKSVFDKFINGGEPIRYNGESRSIGEICVDETCDMRGIFPSATTFAFGKDANVQRQRLFLAPGYAGFPFDDGELMQIFDNGKILDVEMVQVCTDTDYRYIIDGAPMKRVAIGEKLQPNQVPLVNTRDATFIEEHYGLRWAPMNGRAYADPDVYRVQVKNAFLLRDANGDLIRNKKGKAKSEFSGMEHIDYKHWFEGNLAAWMQKVTSEIINGKPADAIVRVMQNNTVTDEIVAAMKLLLPTMTIVTWYDGATGTDKKDKRLTALVEDSRAPGKPMVVFVTGLARMGSVLPSSFRFAEDLVKKPAKQVSVDQAFAGRFCGIGKSPNWVGFNDEETERLRHYIESKGKWDEAGRPLQDGVKNTVSNSSEFMTFRIDNSGSPEDLFCKALAGLLKFDHTQPLGPAQLPAYRRTFTGEGGRRSTKRLMPVLKLARETGLLAAVPRLRFDEYVMIDDDVALTFADVQRGQRRRRRGTEGNLRAYRHEVVVQVERTDGSGEQGLTVFDPELYYDQTKPMKRNTKGTIISGTLLPGEWRFFNVILRAVPAPQSTTTAPGTIYRVAYDEELV